MGGLQRGCLATSTSSLRPFQSDPSMSLIACRVQGPGFRVQGPGARAPGVSVLPARVQGPGFRVQGLGSRGQGSRCVLDRLQCRGEGRGGGGKPGVGEGSGGGSVSQGCEREAEGDSRPGVHWGRERVQGGGRRDRSATCT